MKHRHLNNESALTPPAIDDIIYRGSLGDWCALRDTARGDPEVLKQILTVCVHHIANPEFPEISPQRYHAWKNWVDLVREEQGLYQLRDPIPWRKRTHSEK